VRGQKRATTEAEEFAVRVMKVINEIHQSMILSIIIDYTLTSNGYK